MDDEILNDAEPSLDTVRRWAFDTRLSLIEQDEDLILGDGKYIPLLLELAADPTCPKAKYCLSIVEQHCRFILDWRHRNLAQPILAIGEEALSSPEVDVRNWAVWFKQCVADGNSMCDHSDHIAKGSAPMPKRIGIAGPDASTQSPDIALWKPSLFALLAAGVVAGAILGAANGVLAHYISAAFESVLAACVWGAGLGASGGVIVVLFRRVVWGPDVSVEVGTVLGMLYGIVPGVGILIESIVVSRVVIAGWTFVGFVMAASMVGLLLGGVLDRITESIIARWKR